MKNVANEYCVSTNPGINLLAGSIIPSIQVIAATESSAVKNIFVCFDVINVVQIKTAKRAKYKTKFILKELFTIDEIIVQITKTIPRMVAGCLIAWSKFWR